MSRRHIDSLRDFLTRPCADASRYLGRRTGDGGPTSPYSLTHVSGCQLRGWRSEFSSLL